MTVSSFDIHGLAILDSPVVLSVPHAGRDYPDTAGLLRHPVERLRALEDRHADRLAERAIAAGTTAIIARLPRLWIDLNRATSDLDPGMVVGGHGSAQTATSRMRGGLGLIPRRLGTIGEIWRAALTREDVARRIAGHYDPYHAMIAAMLARAQARFGVALLVDLHSMPPLVGYGESQIVLGDRFGATCAPQLSALAEAVFAGAGYRVGTNAPYAGGHIITRHANRANNVHALQVEVDRTLYLDAALDKPGQGLAALQAVIGRLVETLVAQLSVPTAIAAE
ncbi:N-formylglutamate amidohydrolase [Sphingomonas sp.]|uniref:N-formylglutamate amidohydrolase n=1 Tax=Sphingomonas sp. TaxID=28214 RepID=UPI0025F7FED8|nr:N-formylglutamate amidohydrolase [Sphingomonas sp.]